MEDIIQISINLIQQISVVFKRSIHNEISWNNRLIGIKGARGTGKTTLLLQHLKEHPLPVHQKLYVSLDELYFTQNSLLDFGKEFYLKGGRLLVLDEVHKYEGWSLEIKNLYDRYSDLQIIFTGSSILDITKKEGDLSRRALYYTLQGLSFREYLKLRHGFDFPIIPLEKLLSEQFSYVEYFPKEFRPLAFFTAYLKFGYYPFQMATELDYNQQLRQITRAVVEYDMAEIKGFDVRQAKKMLQLLCIIAQQVPFKPNITQLAAKTQIHRNSINSYLHFLEEAKLISLLTAKPFSVASLQKTEKIYLENTNLIYALAEDTPNIGTVREVFFNNQLQQKHQVHQSSTADFEINERWTFEIVGKSKDYAQIKDVENSWLVKDNIEQPVGRTIPLWIFGFMY